MGRKSRKRPYHEGHRPLNMASATGGEQTVTGPGGLTYRVRAIVAGTKPYVCPGCQLTIPVGASHVVAWTDEAPWGMAIGVDARRHWHTGCWNSARRR